MTKSVISHENNIFDIKATPFLDSWKSATLAQAKLLGIPVEPAKALDFKVISDKIKETLLQRSNYMDGLSHIVGTKDDFASVFSVQEQLCLKKVAFYNIKLDGDQWCNITDLHMLDAVDSWEKQLKEAIVLGVNWKISDYDPEGLERAIEEKEELCAIEAKEERRQANAYYYSTRGC